MHLKLRTCDVRSWRTSDVEPISRHANNHKIWLNLRDAFPHPYTTRDAREWIRGVHQRTPETSFAIAVNDEPIGGIGFVLRQDVERVSAEIGYWLGEPYWGRGIMTAAVEGDLRLRHGPVRPGSTGGPGIRMECSLDAGAREVRVHQRGCPQAQCFQRRRNHRLGNVCASRIEISPATCPIIPLMI